MYYSYYYYDGCSSSTGVRYVSLDEVTAFSRMEDVIRVKERQYQRDIGTSTTRNNKNK